MIDGHGRHKTRLVCFNVGKTVGQKLSLYAQHVAAESVIDVGIQLLRVYFLVSLFSVFTR